LEYPCLVFRLGILTSTQYLNNPTCQLRPDLGFCYKPRLHNSLNRKIIVQYGHLCPRFAYLILPCLFSMHKWHPSGDSPGTFSTTWPTSDITYLLRLGNLNAILWSTRTPKGLINPQPEESAGYYGTSIQAPNFMNLHTYHLNTGSLIPPLKHAKQAPKN
jgi:hypothetical protein